jgi:hypothetical protein
MDKKQTCISNLDVRARRQVDAKTKRAVFFKQRVKSFIVLSGIRSQTRFSAFLPESPARKGCTAGSPLVKAPQRSSAPSSLSSASLPLLAAGSVACSGTLACLHKLGETQMKPQVFQSDSD